MARPCILVVDDDQNDCLVLQRLLAEEGFDVDTAHDALTALKMFGEEAHDLVILDYRMPDMDGLDLFDTIKKQWPSVAVLFHTGYATVDLIDAAIGAGAIRVFAKDVDRTELIEGVKDVLNPKAL